MTNYSMTNDQRDTGPSGSGHSDQVMTDVLIIGSGIAGAVAALRLAEGPAIQVTVVTSTQDPHESSTFYAQGGIIARGPEDSAELLVQDIVRAGAGVNNPVAVRILAEEGPRLLLEFLLERLGVTFSETAGEELEYIREAAHSTERILHAADATGRAIEERLIEALQACPNVTLLSEHTAVDLLTPAHHSRNPVAIYDPVSCVGAYIFNQRQERVITCLARKTILASGGLGQIYLHTTNPEQARGDGLAMAHRAGARIIQAEYVQFHPTAFYHRDAPRFLISEAVRGEGARLVDEEGRAFMQKYDPDWKDLAPRDVVARSIHQQMLETKAPCVYLDLRSYLAADEIKRRFPNIHAQCLTYGIDITKNLIPVVPAAHYLCGGVWVDEWGRTSLRHLYAAGEVSCTGVHGANRLGSASLLEGLVWGSRTAQDIRRTLDEPLEVALADIPLWVDTGLHPPDPALIRQDMDTIKRIMWNYVGLVRSARRLDRAIDDLSHLQVEIDKFYRATKLTDGLIGLRNSVLVGLIVARAAWENKVSRGCHYRED
ncbi:MAG: L-aspartate oxidase [Anaerolineae bacterium]